MRIVQVTPTPAAPPSNGGQWRMHGLMTARGDGDSVVRFAQCGIGVDDDTRTVAPGYREIRYPHLAHSGTTFVTNKLGAPPLLTSTVLRVLRPRELSEAVDGADVVQVEHPWQFAHVERITPDETPIVYSSHNFEPEYYGWLNDRITSKPLFRAVKRIDEAAARRADLLVTTSERDARLYRQRTNVDGPVHVAHNGVSRDRLRNDSTGGPDRRERPLAVFVGSDHPPNVQAVEHLLEIATRSPATGVDFDVVGDVCDSFERTETPDNVTLRGFVDDLDAVHDAADMAVNPVTSGGGSNVKVPEFFARGVPVVTTPFGARGVPAEDGTHFVVADLPSFASAVGRLANDPDERRRLSENARSLVESEITWDRISSALFDRLRTFVDQ